MTFRHESPLSNSAESLPPMTRSLAQTAKQMGISERTLWQLANDGEIPHVRIGRRVLFRSETVIAWLAAREQRGITARPSP